MELPVVLREGLEQAAQGIPLADLSRAVDTLSGRYRQEVMDGAWHVSGDLAARAYLTVRFPATFAALAAAMGEVEQVRPEFQPATHLDVGSGPGTAFWAASGTWDSIGQAVMLEGSPHMREWGQKLGRLSRVSNQWLDVDVRRGLPATGTHDLVTLSYVLNELTPETRPPLIRELWECTGDTLLLLEPGTTAGWQRILEARQQLLTLGAHLLAPCPHTRPCPVQQPDWCHFSVRVARSSTHRRGKGADLAYEDEKFIYLAASRTPGEPRAGRVLTHPSTRSGLVNLKLCTGQGTLEQRTLSKRDGELFKQARRLEWGDALEEGGGESRRENASP
ncbi:small ribosomal subunit Rsm22 family protein [Deinococcus fonticola]|uniref:small ribosomal subunit Rsm22 family protein n=1 Tax=Deinococcus fonticola TaxID=2528713 RepID=UPI001074E4F5|nr:small ribosomal subunit Rsm22 family protein [Deinococcus fonticola]